MIYTLAGIPLYAGMPLLIGAVMDNATNGTVGATAYLAAFCGSSVAAVTLMGGNFGTLIAYEADLFGTKVGFFYFQTVREMDNYYKGTKTLNYD